MKFQKFAALLLTFTVCTMAVASCSTSTTETTAEETKATVATALPKETKETVAIEITESTAETTEETEPDETSESESNSTDIYGEEGVYQYAYNHYMEYIDELEASNPDMRYTFYDYSDEGDCRWTLLTRPADGDTFTQYILENGEIKLGTYINESMPAFTADEIKKLPVLAHLGYTNDELHIVNSLTDGTYYGNIIALSLDGTKAFIEASDPVLIPLTELDGLDKNVEVTDLNGEPIYIPGYGQLITSPNYEYGRNDTMFDGAFIFNRLDDGTAILIGDSDVVVTYNTRFLAIDIAADCEITDNFLFLYGKSEDDETVNEDDNNILKSFYYQCMTDDEYMGKYNYTFGNWSTAYGILEPITVSGGQITNLTFGWR